MKTSETITGSQSPDIEKTINEGLDNAYNTGVQHSIEIVQQYDTGKELSPLIKTLITKLKALKK